MDNFLEKILPRDGRFGSGPSKIRPEQMQAIAAAPFGTSHRKPPVKGLVGDIRSGLTDLFQLPAGYEVLIGNGGASALWDAVAFNLIEKHAQYAVMGEFSGKAAHAAQNAPWLETPEVRTTAPGTIITNETTAGIDTYLYAHNETSTGVCSPLRRYGDSAAGAAGGAGGVTASAATDAPLTIVDGTSIAGGYVFPASEVDFYYFSTQKCFGAEGGLWVAFASPAAVARIEKIAKERWIPDFFNLQIALENSRKNQTYNTPAIGTLTLLSSQIKWMLEIGGMEATAARSRANSQAVYEWAEQHPLATPFVKDPAYRSPVVATVDFAEEVDTKGILQRLRENGVLDIDSYRSLGRNQFRIGAFPAIDTEDIVKLLQCIDACLPLYTKA